MSVSVLALADAVRDALNNHMAKRKEQVLSRQDVPGRPGWALETVLQGADAAVIIVRNVHTGTGYQIAKCERGRDVAFEDSDAVAARMGDAEMLIYSTLAKISVKDDRRWPDLDRAAELANPFWSDFIGQIPNLLEVAQVLMT